MTPEEIRTMEIEAATTISFANSEEWGENDGVRILANLAISAAKELRTLRAENERLRGALEHIANLPNYTGAAELWLSRNEMADIARAALEGGE